MKVLPKALTRVRDNPLVSFRVVKFGIAGGAGMITDTVVLWLLVTAGGVNPVPAKIVAALVAIVVSFSINEIYTYNPDNNQFRAVIRRYLKSNLARSGGVAVATGTLFLLHNVIGVWYILANFAGIGVAFFFNYAVESYFTWRIHDK